MISTHKPLATSSTSQFLRIASHLDENKKIINPPAKPQLVDSKVFKKLDDDLTVAYMNADDIHYVMSTWVLELNWTPTQYGVEPFAEMDKKGYYMLFKNGEPIASLAAVTYPELRVAYLGLYIVNNQYLGKKYSKILWDAVIPELNGQGYNLGLNASPWVVPANVEFYNKLGFHQIGLDEVWRLEKGNDKELEFELPEHAEIVPFTPEYQQQLVEYDAHVFGQERAKFIFDWATKPETLSYVYLQNDKVAGFVVASARVVGTAKEGEPTGYRMGPLYADDKNIAKALLATVIKHSLNNRPLMLDVPANNIEGLKTLLTEAGFALFFKSAKMYTKPEAVVSRQDEKVFGITSLTISPR